MDAWISPTTGDYVPGEATRLGDLQRDPAGGLTNAAVLRLRTPLGSWWADPTLGSRLHELQRLKDLAVVERLARDYAADALQPLVDDGRVRAIDIQTERTKDDVLGGRLSLAVALTAANGQAVAFRFHVKVT